MKLNEKEHLQAAKRRAEAYLGGQMENFSARLGELLIQREDPLGMDFTFEIRCSASPLVTHRVCGDMSIRTECGKGEVIAYLNGSWRNSDCRTCNVPLYFSMGVLE